MICDKPIEPDEDEPRDLAETVRSLIQQAGNPAKVLELYYWSLEPGLLDCIRAIVAMPIEARAALNAFLSATNTAHTITATFDNTGTLSLHSPNGEEILMAFLKNPPRLQS